MSGKIKLPQMKSDKEGGSSVSPVPPGLYNVRVDKFLQKDSGELLAKFIVIDGEHQGKEIWEPFNPQHDKAVKRLHAFLGAIGISPKTTELDPATCIGRELKVTTAERNGWLNVVKHEAATGTRDTFQKNGDGALQC
jgi:hypothetical protein